MQKKTDKQYRSSLTDLLRKVEVNKVKINIDYRVAVDAYLETICKSWSLSTQESEASRIRVNIPHLIKYGLDPEKIYLELVKDKAPYTIRTAFVRLKRFADFCRDLGLYNGTNPFETYMKYTAPNKFKMTNVYKPKVVKMNYDEAKGAIIEGFKQQEDILETALCLLTNGLRISELYKLQMSSDGNWYVVGKGGKIRTILYSPPKNGLCARNKLVAGLARIGFTPHELRKLMATKLANSGLAAHDLQNIMGWSSLMTAQSYLQQSNNNALKQRLQGVL